MLLPEWITDSVAAGQRLPLEEYSLARVRDRPGQKALSGFTPQKASRSTAEVQAAPSMCLPKIAELQESQLLGPEGSQRRPTLDLSLDSFERRSRHEGHQGADEGPAQRPPGSLAGLVGLAKKLQQAQDARVQGSEEQMYQQRESGVRQQAEPASTARRDEPQPSTQNLEADQRPNPAQTGEPAAAAALVSLNWAEFADHSIAAPHHSTEDVDNGQAKHTEVPQEGVQWQHSISEAAQHETEYPDAFDSQHAESADLIQDEHHSLQREASLELEKFPEPKPEHAALLRHEQSSAMGADGNQQNASSAQQQQQRSKQHEVPMMDHAVGDNPSGQRQIPAAASTCRNDGAGSAAAQPLHQAQPRPLDSGAVAGSSACVEQRPLARQPSRHLDINMPMEVLAQDTSQQGAELYAMKARQRCDLLRGPPRSSRDDPAFQQTYFSASRLHFIGSWKARNEALLLGMVNEGPKPSTPPRGGSRTIVHIDMDCFFASVAGRRRIVYAVHSLLQALHRCVSADIEEAHQMRRCSVCAHVGVARRLCT